jgi:glycosyltransferase involved in cell wall biosynthesis
MENSPFISVVTPSFNQGEFIRKNLESVREQNFDGVEHIVIDGGSKDQTTEILKEYPEVQWVSEPDQGQTDALNKGIEKARGEWICWINSDDYLLPGALESFEAFVREHPEAEFVYSDCVFVDEKGEVIEKRPANYTGEKEFLYTWWRGGSGFAQPGTFFRRKLWERFGPFDISLHYTMDYDFWLKISDEVDFLYLPAELATYRLHGSAKTSEGWDPFVREKIQVARRHWDKKGVCPKWKYRYLLSMMWGKKQTWEGVRRWKAGHRKEAFQRWWCALQSNPLSLILCRAWLELFKPARGKESKRTV